MPAKSATAKRPTNDATSQHVIHSLLAHDILFAIKKQVQNFGVEKKLKK
jgi:hypothetical protein